MSCGYATQTREAANAGELKEAAPLKWLRSVTFVPCVGTLAAIRQETRSWKWTFFSAGLMLVASLVLGTAIYRVGQLF